jgi:hypothetical protein
MVAMVRTNWHELAQIAQDEFLAIRACFDF